MSFAFTEDQQLLVDSAEKYLQAEYTFDARGKTLSSDEGWSRDSWAAFAEMGWLALPIPEEYGGLGGSTVDMAALLEQMGKVLVVEPVIATLVLGAEAVALAGSEAQKTEILGAVAEGGMTLALGHGEPGVRDDLAHVTTTATQDGDGWRLSGHKAVVHHAATADRIIVSARVSGDPASREGIGLFMISPGAEGVELRSYPTMDGLQAADVILDNVSVSAADVLGDPSDALEAIEAVVDRARVLLAAEACGAMDSAVRLTTEYLKTREQFGVPLSSFQVLQHRAVDMLSATTFARALTYRSAGGIDSSTTRAERAKAASAAKAEIGKAGKLVGQESIQLHGGMGMSAEMAIGHYFKRLTMIDVMFGNQHYHLRRFAKAA